VHDEDDVVLFFVEDGEEHSLTDVFRVVFGGEFASAY
jgi:hypothetical protein